MFCKSCADLAALCAQYQIPMQFYFLFNESLIPRARNYCTDEFDRAPAEHMMFIDADIGFSPQDVIALMALQVQNEQYDIIGAPYPKKCISWEKIKLAVDKGMADEDPTILDKFVGDYVFNPKYGQQAIPIGEPVEVLEIGTGMMMIRKEALHKFKAMYPQYMYKPDHARTEHFDGSREIMMYFQSEIDPKSKRYLSEDYWFCATSSCRITTQDGIKTIKEIVDNKYSGKVLSLNEKGKIEWNNIIDWFARRNGKRSQPETKKKWVRINTDIDNNTKAKLKCTEDHEIGVFDDIFDPHPYFKQARDCYGRFVVKNIDNRDNNHKENALYGKEQLSILAGTLMGDASIGSNYQLLITHCEEQKEYIDLKAKIFNGKVSDKNEQRGFGEGKYKYDMHTPVNAQTRYLRNKIYKNGKKEIKNLLPLIDEKGLTFWYMDDGSYDGHHDIYLCTYSFTYDEHLEIQKWFKDKWNIDCEISIRKTKYKGEEKEYHYIRMNKDDSDKFFSLIAYYVPKSMEYKLPEYLRNADDKFDFNSLKSLDFAAAFIKSVDYCKNQQLGKLYDITVENVHNFFGDGILIHNCQKAQEAGLRTWLCPWMKTQHVGSYIFSGSLADLASIGAAATVDPSQLKKGKVGILPVNPAISPLTPGAAIPQATQMLSKFGAIVQEENKKLSKLKLPQGKRKRK